MYLAQLSEEGGAQSITYFERGCEVLRNEIDVLSSTLQDDDEDGTLLVKFKQAKLSEALCGMAEVYMTDLSFEDDAEQKCEAYITEAVAVCPDELAAGTLQVLASVRISQERVEEAKQALQRSMSVWKDIPPEAESDSRPDFATRVSLSRLLMEVDMLAEATAVIEGLIKDDDESVESWYLGGWCQVLVAQQSEGDQTQAKEKAKEKAKVWVDTCLRLYQIQEYEDERLREHALELRGSMNKDLGVEDGDEAWEDEEEEDGDEELEIVEDDQVNGDGRKGDHDGDVDMT